MTKKHAIFEAELWKAVSSWERVLLKKDNMHICLFIEGRTTDSSLIIKQTIQFFRAQISVFFWVFKRNNSVIPQNVVKKNRRNFESKFYSRYIISLSKKL